MHLKSDFWKCINPCSTCRLRQTAREDRKKAASFPVIQEEPQAICSFPATVGDTATRHRRHCTRTLSGAGPHPGCVSSATHLQSDLWQGSVSLWKHTFPEKQGMRLPAAVQNRNWQYHCNHSVFVHLYNMILSRVGFRIN